MFRELNWLSFGHMKSSRAGPLFGFKPAGCRALGKGSRGSRPGERPVKRGKSARGCPLCRRPCARHVETPRSSPHRTSHWKRRQRRRRVFWTTKTKCKKCKESGESGETLHKFSQNINGRTPFTQEVDTRISLAARHT